MMTSQQIMGASAPTGMPGKRRVIPVPQAPQNSNTSGPTPEGHLDNFNADNGAVGANAMANPTANSGTTFGNALTQLYGTQAGSPTLQGGNFPPGAPTVSGNQQFQGPSLQNSQGNAAADTVQRISYGNSINAPASSMGAAINNPPQNQGFGDALMGLQSGKIGRKLAAQPQPPLNLALTFPQSNLGGGLR